MMALRGDFFLPTVDIEPTYDGLGGVVNPGRGSSIRDRDRVSSLGRFHPLNHFAQLLHRYVLNLPDAFARDAKFLAYFLECLLGASIQAKTSPEDDRFARVERFHHLLQHSRDGLLLELF